MRPIGIRLILCPAILFSLLKPSASTPPNHNAETFFSAETSLSNEHAGRVGSTNHNLQSAQPKKVKTNKFRSIYERDLMIIGRIKCPNQFKPKRSESPKFGVVVNDITFVRGRRFISKPIPLSKVGFEFQQGAQNGHNGGDQLEDGTNDVNEYEGNNERVIAEMLRTKARKLSITITPINCYRKSRSLPLTEYLSRPFTIIVAVNYGGRGCFQTENVQRPMQQAICNLGDCNLLTRRCNSQHAVPRNILRRAFRYLESTGAHLSEIYQNQRVYNRNRFN